MKSVPNKCRGNIRIGHNFQRRKVGQIWQLLGTFPVVTPAAVTSGYVTATLHIKTATLLSATFRVGVAIFGGGGRVGVPKKRSRPGGKTAKVTKSTLIFDQIWGVGR